MAKRESLTYRILREHLVSGELEPGQKIAIRIDQTLTQDATGTMAYLQFEALGVPRVRTELSVSYVDHNTLQTGFENADDHRYLQTVAAKYGLLLLARRQRHLPPGAPRALRRARARRCSAPTATRPTAAASGCWRSAPAASTWRWRWPASPSTLTAARGDRRAPDRRAARRGSRRRTSSSSCCAA